jgi:uncharacterized protein (DUF58 family)
MKKRYQLRLPFWIFAALTVLVALAAMNSGNNLLFWIFGVMASALLVSGIVSGSMLRGLAVRRMLPQHGAVGEPMAVRYLVSNRNRLLPTFSVHFSEDSTNDGHGWRALMGPAAAWVMHIGPRETVHGEATFWPTRRGEAHFDGLRIATSFPFGIVGKSIVTRQPQRILVYPRLYALHRRVFEAIAPAGSVGTRVSPHAGAGDDYYGLREFRLGDSMRHIAWKRTANRDELLCIERTRPSPPKMRVLLDLTTPTEAVSAARELEERAISLVASLVHGADLGGFEVGLTILGIDRPPLPVRRSHWHRDKIMAALAELDLDASRRGAAAFSGEGESAALVVVHPERPDPSLVRGEAWHFTAAQMDRLVERAIGWAPAERDPAEAVA